ncbi:GNAT family N-acetyltransferase [Shewanella sp. 5_MG-2023]|uniref:GNAT family N-acetyltransferase n=1 Tax=Shewanella sp. 5_MG-2023 TaxID=3062656 RepID=UPI0026E482BF|nr:GNAT family N-acetyltransferase [Shewanella sp. 5_MG-2023]MDO6640854.1 GNAT family N-acetyltransferase [Shewanella sp. 5_MG-2023]
MAIKYKEVHGDFIVYLEEHPKDCYCMWRKDDHQNMFYSIERIDVLPELRRTGIARDLLNTAIEHIQVECNQACIEIIALPDESSEVTKENLVTFYVSLGFELYQDFGIKVVLRRYLDESIKPQPLYDSPDVFKSTWYIP